MTSIFDGTISYVNGTNTSVVAENMFQNQINNVSVMGLTWIIPMVLTFFTMFLLSRNTRDWMVLFLPVYASIISIFEFQIGGMHTIFLIIGTVMLITNALGTEVMGKIISAPAIAYKERQKELGRGIIFNRGTRAERLAYKKTRPFIMGKRKDLQRYLSKDKNVLESLGIDRTETKSKDILSQIGIKGKQIRELEEWEKRDKTIDLSKTRDNKKASLIGEILMEPMDKNEEAIRESIYKKELETLLKKRKTIKQTKPEKIDIYKKGKYIDIDKIGKEFWSQKGIEEELIGMKPWNINMKKRNKK